MRRITVLVLGTLFLLAGPGRAASERYTKEDMPQFLTDLKSEDAKVRIQACQGIAEVGEIKAAQAKAAVDPLLELLESDDDPKVRAAAALALGRIEADPVWTIPALIEAIKTDPDRFVVAAAITSLGVYGKEAKEALPLLKELGAKVREETTALRNEIIKAQKDMDQEKLRMIQMKGNPAFQLAQALGTTTRMIQGEPGR